MGIREGFGHVTTLRKVRLLRAMNQDMGGLSMITHHNLLTVPHLFLGEESILKCPLGAE